MRSAREAVNGEDTLPAALEHNPYKAGRMLTAWNSLVFELWDTREYFSDTKADLRLRRRVRG